MTVQVLTYKDARLVPGQAYSSDMLPVWRLRESLARDDMEYFQKHGGKAKDIELSRSSMLYAQACIREIEEGIARQRGAK